MNINARAVTLWAVVWIAGTTARLAAQDQATEQPPPAPAPAAAPAAPATPAEQAALAGPIEFQGAPVTAVVDYYARLTGRSIISQPNLPGTIVFRAQTPLTKEEAIWAIESVLAINGIGLVPLGDKFLKVVQIAGAKQEGVAVGVLVHEGDAGALEGAVSGRDLPAADSLVTHIIPLKFADAGEIVAALQPYLHAYGQLIPMAKSGSILITETAGNIKQMLEIIHYVDQPSQLRMETKVYVLQNARAADVVTQIQAILQQAEQIGAQPGAPPTQPGQPRPPAVRQPAGRPAIAGQGGSEAESAVEGKVAITADARTNKIFLLSRPANVPFFDRLIEELDAKIEPDVLTKVIALDYANAEDVAALLSSLITGAALPARARPAGGGAAAPPPPTVAGAAGETSGLFEYAEGVRILPDTRTNSLLVMASKNDLARIEALIRHMDTEVAQVVVEVVIAEVKLAGSLEVGVAAIKRLFNKGQVTQTGASGVGVGDQPPPANLGDLGGEELLSGLGSNIAPLAVSAATGGLTYFLTFQNLRLDAVVRALADSSKFKVLSTPIIQTLHNQEATILVGESRPVPTSTVSDVVSSGTTAVRASIEFKDIAIELRVTPRINPNGMVTMDIEQKINDFGGNVPVGDVLVPIITKREAKSSIAVHDQSTVVLGGLIREDKNLSESKVPLLGDIPFLGHLFKTKSTEKTRTELIVFIRPTVLRNDAEAVAEARRRSDMLKAGKELELDKAFAGKASAGLSDGDLTETNQPPAEAVPPPETPAEPNQEPQP